MIKFVEDEFKHELWGYRKFRTFRGLGAEQRPWLRARARSACASGWTRRTARIRGEIAKREA